MVEKNDISNWLSRKVDSSRSVSIVTDTKCSHTVISLAMKDFEKNSLCPVKSDYIVLYFWRAPLTGLEKKY